MPAGETFRYFYRVDDTPFVPDCPMKEKDDFGFENCIYDPHSVTFMACKRYRSNNNFHKRGFVMKITMKIPYLIVAITMFFSSLCFATENIALSTSVQAQIEAQAKEMSTVGVPAEPARNMLTAMHQHQFTSQNIVRAQQEVMNCAKAGLPTEPVMNKASEGMAKKASEQQIIAAMQTVHSRYAHANRMAKTMSKDKNTVDKLTHSIADSLAAGMKAKDMEAIMLQLKTRTKTQIKNKSEEDKLATQTMQTTRTMARLGIHSSEVSDTICQALQNNYSHQEMEQLQHQMANNAHQVSPQQIANQHANAIGKGGNSRGSTVATMAVGGSDGGSGGSGGGSGGSGGGSGGSGGGSGGSGSGSGGSGGGSGGSGGGSGGSGGGSN